MGWAEETVSVAWDFRSRSLCEDRIDTTESQDFGRSVLNVFGIMLYEASRVHNSNLIQLIHNSG
jgi:hypothetical protein